jgi:hypothetical protein
VRAVFADRPVVEHLVVVVGQPVVEIVLVVGIDAGRVIVAGRAGALRDGAARRFGLTAPELLHEIVEEIAHSIGV